MSLSFIMPLAITLLAVYILQNSADEISYLAAAISLVGLFVSLVVAPWQIQVLLLLVVLLSARRLLQQCQPVVDAQFEAQSEPKIEPQSEFQEDDKTQLSYRGINYESTPAAVEVAEVEVTGKYRGQVCKVRKTENMPVSQPTSGLKYRGATVIPQASPTPLVEESKQTPES
ncbi:DUF4278 domain-containing protein [Coleofasciculus sp. FACHB-SPT36]|uniref:DUF4278 domain-containing protein n=1 Tax=Cyanophyceae TaxID=3028117 RepID=UPI00168AEF99|nr:DUF4278 domain-containing protein [Coleofasciculus sp. FACHB-SPT36]MBD2541055.1 DUF4278 domain-containing protein [Coleofasciculus sp. FACHB-SPT36]